MSESTTPGSVELDRLGAEDFNEAAVLGGGGKGGKSGAACGSDVATENADVASIGGEVAVVGEGDVLEAGSVAVVEGKAVGEVGDADEAIGGDAANFDSTVVVGGDETAVIDVDRAADEGEGVAGIDEEVGENISSRLDVDGGSSCTEL